MNHSITIDIIGFSLIQLTIGYANDIDITNYNYLTGSDS